MSSLPAVPLALIEIGGQGLQLIDRVDGPVIELGVVDELARSALVAIERRGDVVELGHDRVEVLDGCLAGGDDVLDGGHVLGGELVAAPDLRAGGVLAADVDDGVAEDAGGLKVGDGVLVQRPAEARRELHGDFDGREPARWVGGDLDVSDFADGDAFERDGSTFFDAGGIVKEGVDDDALLEESDAGGAGHKEEQQAKEQRGDEDDAADLELRPPDLSLTGQAKPPVGPRFHRNSEGKAEKQRSDLCSLISDSLSLRRRRWRWRARVCGRARVRGGGPRGELQWRRRGRRGAGWGAGRAGAEPRARTRRRRG